MITLGAGIVLLGYLLLVRWDPPRRRLPVGVRGLFSLGAVGLLIGGWLVMNYEYLRPHTALTEVKRWPLTPLVHPHGIAYQDGQVFITDFAGGTVSVLDTRTGAHRLPLPLSGGSGAYARPGTIQLGPDGKLYLLNNGPGTQALLVLEPNGRVVAQRALNGKSETAIGLAFPASGDALYVSDMGASRVWEYPPTGGDPIHAWPGPGAGFTNLSGLALAPDGTIFAADESRNVVHELRPDRQWGRSFALPCAPKHLVLRDDWIDVACYTTLTAINWRTGELRSVRGAPGTLLPTDLGGLTYAPDGTLYVVDRTSLRAYRVAR
jgi:DNA-binding beta-propeller fold protein YncE